MTDIEIIDVLQNSAEAVRAKIKKLNSDLAVLEDAAIQIARIADMEKQTASDLAGQHPA